MTVYFYFMSYIVPILIFSLVLKCPVQLVCSVSAPTQDHSPNLIAESLSLLHSDTTSLFDSTTLICWASWASFQQAVHLLDLSGLSLMMPLDLIFLPSISYNLEVSFIGLIDPIHKFFIKNHHRWCCDLILHWDTWCLMTPLVDLTSRLQW